MTHEQAPEAISPDDFSDFERAYVECMLWSSNDESDESGGEPLDANYDQFDLAQETLLQIRKECDEFQAQNTKLLAQAGDDEQNGHDFWLTRNGHGTGFWDRGYPKEIGQALTEAAEQFGEQWPYVGDDGLIYLG